MVARRFGVLGLWLAVCAATPMDASLNGLKIVTRETFPAGVMDTTAYVASDRARIESRLVSQAPGAKVEEGRHVQIRRCDLNRMFFLDLQRRTYLATPLRADLNAAERVAISAQRVPKPSPAAPQIVVETTTIDTGERRTAFGYPARRVVTTRRQMHPGESTATGETITDGWYIDAIDPQANTACERDESGARAVLIAVASTTDTRTDPARVVFKDVGRPERGFAIETRVTWRSAGGGTTGAMPASHSQVTEISRQALSPALFEVPAGFRAADGFLTQLAGRLTRTVHIIHAALASWFR